MLRTTLLAVPITRVTPPLAVQVQAARDAGAELVELRVDLLADADAVGALLGRPALVPLVVTIREAAEGGAWNGTDADRAALLERLGALRPAYIDVELAAWERSKELRDAVHRVCGEKDAAGPADGSSAGGTRKTRLILSHHDLAGTPADIDGAMASLVAARADVVKAVFTARDATDSWRVMEWLRRQAQHRPVAALAMGEAGLLTRILARKFGGFLTFATRVRGEESAPGQPTLRELIDVFRWRAIGAGTRVYGVVGWPVGHSRSPLIHNAAMGAAGVDGVYVPMPVLPRYGDAARFLDYLTDHPELDVGGLSITIPHKEHAWRWLRERGGRVSEMAERCEAVNTLTRTGPATWSGDNTDASGAIAALANGLGGVAALRGQRAAVLGAGGAARAVVAALLDQGCAVTVFNRTAVRAAALAQKMRCDAEPWEARLDWRGEILVNCTSVGMQPGVNDSPMPHQSLQEGMYVLDTVYTPAQTRLLRDAQAAGCTAISGVEMFIGQAAGQFEMWHARAAPLEVLRAAAQAGASHD